MTSLTTLCTRLLSHPCCHRIVDESGATTEDSDSGEDQEDDENEEDNEAKEKLSIPNPKKMADKKQNGPPPPPPPPPTPSVPPVRRSTIPPPEAEAVKYGCAMRKLLDGLVKDSEILQFFGMHEGFYLEPADATQAIMFYKKKQLVPETPLDYVNAVPHFYLPSECPYLVPLASAVHSSLFLCAWIQPPSGPAAPPKSSTNDTQRFHQQLFALTRAQFSPEWKVYPVRGIGVAPKFWGITEYLTYINKILETKGAQWTLEDIVPMDKKVVIRQGSDCPFNFKS